MVRRWCPGRDPLAGLSANTDLCLDFLFPVLNDQPIPSEQDVFHPAKRSREPSSASFDTGLMRSTGYACVVSIRMQLR